MNTRLDANVLFRLVPLDAEAVEQGMEQATNRTLSELFGVSESSISRYRSFGWGVWEAERWATHWGLMPQQVWDEWDRLCDELCGVVRP